MGQQFRKLPEERLDVIYFIRTSENAHSLSAPDTVRTYKSLAQVEQAFRSFKNTNLGIHFVGSHKG